MRTIDVGTIVAVDLAKVLGYSYLAISNSIYEGIKVMAETKNKTPQLLPELEFYIQHHSELVSKYLGRYIVIIGNEVVGDYATRKEAYWESREKFTLGTFLIQLCMPGKENFAQWFRHHVRV
ncbi:MAG: hypothetical protein KBF73_10740 [Flavobacteriales bacterium]|nr:hypothetical protein [Flavobacteriales bacterium]